MENLTYTLQVKKFKEGWNSTYRWETKNYYFEAIFTFSNGSRVKMILGGKPLYRLNQNDPNSKWYIQKALPEYADLETLEPTKEEIAKATAEAIQDYENAKKWMGDPNFLYSRQKNYGICFYFKDDNSPTGVRANGGCSTSELCDLVARELGKNGYALSPTEDLRTAR
jgi:hypothetical protein